MDKFYFIAPEGNAPQAIRGLLSEMTCIALDVEGRRCESSKLINFVQQLKTIEHYQQRHASFQSDLEGDLYSACSYWEEMDRYHVCWPIIIEFCFEKDAKL
ncbi:hypothetical protein [Aliivibrio kagoshimensis]|uniref:hypothetical protein n=1 Tax=Aliivibrio kagoshimensis TaxID=2910230 RepID=UPI003D14E6D5